MATVKEIIITWVQFKQSWLSEAPWLCWTLFKVPCKIESERKRKPSEPGVLKGRIETTSREIQAERRGHSLGWL